MVQCRILKAVEPPLVGRHAAFQRPAFKPPISRSILPAIFPGSEAGTGCSNENISYVSYILKTGPLLVGDSGFRGEIKSPFL